MSAVPVSASIAGERIGADPPAAGGLGAVTLSGSRQYWVVDIHCREWGFIPRQGETVEESPGVPWLAAVDQQEPAMGGDQGGGHSRQMCGIGRGGVLDDDDGPRGCWVFVDTFGELGEADSTGLRCRADAGQVSTGVGSRGGDRFGEFGV